MIKIIFSTLLTAAFLAGNIPSLVYAQEVSNNIRTLLSSQGKVLYGDEPNSIIVIDYPENVKRVAEYLDVLDVAPRQVLIEARIVEVKLQKEHALGINWVVMADKGYIPMGRFKTGGFTALGSPPIPPQQNINFKPTFYPPAQTSTGQESPFTYAIFDDNINIVLRTLASALDTNLLFAPKITTINNREAEIKVTQKLPWAEPEVSVEGTSGTITVTWEINFEEVGITLKVTPTITEDGNIMMVLSPEVSEKTSDYTLTVTQGTTSVPYTVPIIDKRSASTKVVVGDGQTLIIGGMIKDKITKGETKIPLIGDIPYLGYLFKSKKDTYDKTELLIFVSPKVITPDEYVYMARQEKYLTEKGYQKERQRQKEGVITAQGREKEKNDLLSARLDLLTEKQKALTEERIKLGGQVAKEQENLKILKNINRQIIKDNK